MSRTIIRPPGRLNLPAWRELWETREILYRFGQRDVLLRYRQTAIGVVWVVLQPIAAAGIFSIVFGQIAGLSSSGMPYFVFTFAGMLAWNVFNGVVTRGAGSLVANQALVSKVFFPRLLVPLSTVLSVLLDFAVGLAMFAVLLVVFGVNPGWAVLLTPLWLLVTVMLASGLALILAATTVTYRDVTYVLPWALQILLYATPIAYSLAALPESAAHLSLFFDLNPLTWVMESFRWSLLGLEPAAWWQPPAAVAAALVVFGGGLLFFQRFERGFADVI